PLQLLICGQHLLFAERQTPSQDLIRQRLRDSAQVRSSRSRSRSTTRWFLTKQTLKKSRPSLVGFLSLLMGVDVINGILNCFDVFGVVIGDFCSEGIF
ncbi:MAG: hypothetical protein L0I30_07630, partial [Lacticaseibacillus paracasei]|nr:hypothetical protein [Lacticaseibacillus paracasei]